MEVMDNDANKSTDELLIDCVRGYPHLYNHKDKNFKNNLMRENSLREIASVTKMSGKINWNNECDASFDGLKTCSFRVSSTMTRLREKFAREKRQMEIETRSGSEANRRTTFALYETMLFLEKHVKRRQSYTNMSKASKRPKLAFDTERNSIVELELLISILNENSEQPMPTTSSDADNVSYTPNLMTHGQISSLSPVPQLSSPVQIMRKSFSGWEDSCSNHSMARSTLSPAPLQSESRSTPSPAPLQSGSRSTPSPAPAPPSREYTPNKKKTKDLSKMEKSFLNLTQVMQQRFMAPLNSGPTSITDHSFASLIVAELKALPESEKRSRKQRILQILYEPYNA